LIGSLAAPTLVGTSAQEEYDEDDEDDDPDDEHGLFYPNRSSAEP
jgi:hypothetical protein